MARNGSLSTRKEELEKRLLEEEKKYYYAIKQNKNYHTSKEIRIQMNILKKELEQLSNNPDRPNNQ